MITGARRRRTALAPKGLGYEPVPIDLVAGEQRGEASRSVNPQDFVRVRVVDGVPLTQSLAIIDWLDAAVPARRLIPVDPAERAQAWAQALAIAAEQEASTTGIGIGSARGSMRSS